MADEPKPVKPPEVFLISIKITGPNAPRIRKFVRQIAYATEIIFKAAACWSVCEVRQLNAPMHHGISYELNLTRWEPIEFPPGRSLIDR